uniref:Uncharacterized protein n=1 Tax=Apteryx owenii TaxID=8824 RepID=A0A8B9NYR0_APTOW
FTAAVVMWKKGKLTHKFIAYKALTQWLKPTVFSKDIYSVCLRILLCDSVIFDLDSPQLGQLSRITWYKGNISSKHWIRGDAVSGQRIHVYPNGALGIRNVVKEDAGWYTAMVFNSSEHLLYQKIFQLHVHGRCKFSLESSCLSVLGCLVQALVCVIMHR